MNKNEVRNFIKLYKNTVCLDGQLRPLKLLDEVIVENCLQYLVILEDGKEVSIDSSSKIIALKGKLKERDYNFIEAKFYKGLQ